MKTDAFTQTMTQLALLRSTAQGSSVTAVGVFTIHGATEFADMEIIVEIMDTTILIIVLVMQW
jgi:hypothetical protein